MMSFLRRELFWMLLSLALSIALWMVVTNQQNPPTTDYLQTVQVKLRGDTPGLVARDEIKPVRLKITAPKDVWERLSSASFEAYVDVSKAGPGIQDLPIHVETTDQRVRIDEVQPPRATVRLEPLASKDVPVRVLPVGSVPLGYTSKPATVTPEQVTVSGPQGQINLVTTVVAEIHLDDLRSNISQPIKPLPRNSDGEDVSGVAIKPESVFVEVPVEREVTYKTVPVAPRLSGTVSIGYQIVGMMVDPTAVTVVGDPSALADLSYLPTKPVDVSSVKSDTTAVIEPDPPEGITLARKQNLSVRIFVSAVESSQVFHVAPSLQGVTVAPGGASPSVDPPALNLVLSGPMPVLTTVKPQDIRIIADATDLGPGTYTITPTITVPAGLRLDSVSPDKLVVNIH